MSRLWFGLLGAPFFLTSLLVFGALNPGYRHSQAAVSRLGAFGAPWFLAFDFLGLLIPGLLTAGVALGLRRSERAAGAVTRSSGGLLLFGVMFGLAAIPADYREMFRSPWTWLHTFFVTVPPLIYFAAIPGCARSLRRLGVSRFAAGVFFVLGYLPLAEFSLYGVLGDRRGLVQRLTIVTVHLGIAWLSWTLLGIERSGPGPRLDAPGGLRAS